MRDGIIRFISAIVLLTFGRRSSTSAAHEAYSVDQVVKIIKTLWGEIGKDDGF